LEKVERQQQAMSEYRGAHRREETPAAGETYQRSSTRATGRGRTADTGFASSGDLAYGSTFAAARDARLRKSRVLLIVGFALVAVALIIAAFLLVRYFSANATYHQAQQVAGLTPETSASQVPIVVEDGLSDINWEALRKISPNTVAWLLVDGTRISYPIVQTTDNDYYLTHLFDNSYSTVGSIFLDCDNTATFADRNVMLYGHNMLDGSMFADLLKFRDQKFFDTHRSLHIATPARVMSLRTVAVVVCDGTAELRQLNFADDAAFASYLAGMENLSVVVDRQALEQADQLYCLVNCTDFGNTKRVILLATPVQGSGEQVVNND
jgi:sortase B